MAAADRGEIGWGSLRAYAGERRSETQALLARIRAEGPLAASDFEGGKRNGGWMGWGDTKRALEWLFWAGHITTATHRARFERLSDVNESVHQASILPLPTPAGVDANRRLVALSCRHYSNASESDTLDYFLSLPAS